MADLPSLLQELTAYSFEKEWFEFKKDWYEPYELGEYISALANSAAYCGRSSAYLVWGVEDGTHALVGTAFNYDQNVKNEPLQHFLARQLEPYVNFAFHEALIQGKRIVVLTIAAAKGVPTAFRQKRYIRIGSSKEQLQRYPEKESYLFAVLRQGLPSMENTPSEYQDLTFEQLLIYYGAKGLRLRPDTFEKNLGLRTEDGRYNLLAQVLADNSHLPLRVALFSGTSKADKLYSVREFGYRCLLYSLDEVLRYGDVLNLIQADEEGRVVERKEVPLFEEAAFREAIINAFVHNKWVTGNEPMITIYSDRIEILSRGSLAPEQTMEGFFAGESVPVNKKLSEIFLQLHISEKTGRGVPTITEKYGRKSFAFRENAIVVTIPFRWLNPLGSKPGEGMGKKPQKGASLSTLQGRILAEMRHNPHITKKELAPLLGVGKTTVDTAITNLRQRGYLTRVGSNKTGYWKALG